MSMIVFFSRPTASPSTAVTVGGFIKKEIYSQVRRLLLASFGHCYYWNMNARAEQIDQKVIGIVGLGRIGEKVARVFSALGAKILYTDPSVRNKNYEKVSIEGIFKTAHAVLLSCTAERSNYNLVNNDLLKHSRNLKLINIARGEIVCESSVLAAIEDNKLSYYATDVIANEQKGSFNSNLWQASLRNPKIFITPHTAGLSYESEKFAIIDVVKQIKKLLEVK